MAKPSRTANLKAVSKEVQKEIEELQREMGIMSTAFQLISNSLHPGQASGSVLAVLQWLDKKHTPLAERLKVIAPPPKAAEAPAPQANA